MDDVRIDKWLWAARFFKSRTLAAAACRGGKVDVNDQAARPSRTVRAGDLLKITLPRVRRVIRVVALTDRRGSGTDAALLYQDLTPAAPPGGAPILPPPYRSPGSGRPTKRERRLTERLRGW
jgi:ribosome-associated heat shock protein Hsp15